MLEAIPADQVDTDGEALAVRFRPDPYRPELLLVSIMVHRTEVDHAVIRRSELRLVAMAERMTRDAMRARVEAEAKWRAIRRVAWIEEEG
jgi:hypothetical protein